MIVSSQPCARVDRRSSAHEEKTRQCVRALWAARLHRFVLRDGLAILRYIFKDAGICVLGLRVDLRPERCGQVPRSQRTWLTKQASVCTSHTMSAFTE